jgi:hypothetical protein
MAAFSAGANTGLFLADSRRFCNALTMLHSQLPVHSYHAALGDIEPINIIQFPSSAANGADTFAHHENLQQEDHPVVRSNYLVGNGSLEIEASFIPAKAPQAQDQGYTIPRQPPMEEFPFAGCEYCAFAPGKTFSVDYELQGHTARCRAFQSLQGTANQSDSDECRHFRGYLQGQSGFTSALDVGDLDEAPY